VIPRISHRLASPKIDAVRETNWKQRNGYEEGSTVMTALKIRSALTRLLVVAGLAAILATGTFVGIKPSHTSAAPISCSTKWHISGGYLAMRDMFYAVGMYDEGNYYAAMSDAWFNAC
jgi:hypothetical protein